MRKGQEITDKLSISLSALCVVHCLALPVLLLLLPSLEALQLHNEAVHIWLLIAVTPISIYALINGCNKHKRYQLLTVGTCGLLTLILAAVFGHDIAGEAGEKALTVLGAGIVIAAHWGNFRQCQKHRGASCSESSSEHLTSAFDSK
ncbi:MerC domain-containing protein [Psychrobium sp. 1_MG-2023]|uniref:MerC domain-containing protein n=1 Tax=Psychrobium sp. 1_MG-2023 TaxID=3062624 RepID=UPI000C347C56|nr:MerC domain-containing protein [Psychrobium sp. 1_MG-2023]MDP2561359.1 MerC domain-containing protein [Psychrobium sp. 1_MG-2023]PKF54840.1 MerC domain-containing protein [Alteromonadales bacterium alter-6D02]